MQGGEDDLDALLKHFQLQDKKAKAIEIHQSADPPSARLFANFTPIPGAVSTLHSCCCCPITIRLCGLVLSCSHFEAYLSWQWVAIRLMV